MQVFESYLVMLLQKRIKVDDKLVPVVKHFSEEPGLPLVTLDLSPGITTRNVHREIDETEYLLYHRQAGININVWARDEKHRTDICHQILELYRKDQTFHYTLCSRYNDGICSTLDDVCPASLDIGNGRSVKGKCTNPELYGYESLASRHGIIFDTVVVEPPFDMDEVDKHPPLLKSVLRASCEYMEAYDLGGTKLRDVRYHITVK